MALVVAITWQCSRRPHLGTVITSSVRVEDPVRFPGQQDGVDPQPQHEDDNQQLQWGHLSMYKLGLYNSFIQVDE